ncbi:MAG: Beta-lactamase class C-like and penicillin binding proteins (PBPs) superfamily, partial [uncultured Chloroflexia bacterium]
GYVLHGRGPLPVGSGAVYGAARSEGSPRHDVYAARGVTRNGEVRLWLGTLGIRRSAGGAPARLYQRLQRHDLAGPRRQHCGNCADQYGMARYRGLRNQRNSGQDDLRSTM